MVAVGAGIAAAVLAIALLMVSSGGKGEVSGGTSASATGGGLAPSPSPILPPRPPFVFRIDEVEPVKTEKPNRPAATDAAIDMAGRLSSFYDAAFLDPQTWRQGLADTAWHMFGDSVVEQAMKDAGSLSLADRGADITTLAVEDTSLTFTVLLDPGGQPDTAVAEVSFSASGTRADGRAIEVTNTATFLFDQVAGSWVVVGYPNARTVVSAVEPSAGPSTSPSATETAPPSAGASP